MIGATQTVGFRFVQDVRSHIRPCRSAETNLAPGLTLTLTLTLTPTLIPTLWGGRGWQGSHAAPPRVSVAFFQKTAGGVERTRLDQ